MKNQTTLKITTGAMMIAIFALLLIINRQTGSLFEELLLYIMPLPMTAYCVRFDWKAGLPVMAAMILTSFIFGTFTTIFYAASQCLTGLIFGTCLYRKVDATKTLFAVLLLSVISNLLNTIVLASFFGYDLNRDIAEIQTMMNTTFQTAGVALPEGFLSANYLMRMMVISMILLGMVQGYVVYILTLLVLRRLNFHVEKPKSIYTYYPPKWMGITALILFLLFFFTSAREFADERIGQIIQTVGMCGYFYLLFFGWVYLMLYLLTSGMRSRGVRILIVAALTMFLIIPVILLGAYYILSSQHQKLLLALQSQNQGNEKRLM